MSANYLEHANITVADPRKSAELLCKVFDWRIRWEGGAREIGQTVHVGSDSSYVAFYTQPDITEDEVDSYKTLRMANHLGVVVKDMAAIRRKVVEAGLSPGEIYDYEPGQRFYFFTPDNIEIEVVEY